MELSKIKASIVLMLTLNNPHDGTIQNKMNFVHFLFLEWEDPMLVVLDNATECDCFGFQWFVLIESLFFFFLLFYS